MKVFAISSRILALLDEQFDGQIGNALAGVTRSGSEPELRGKRGRGPRDELYWSIIVSGDGTERQFSAAHSPLITAIAAYLLVVDFTAEVRADLATTVRDQNVLDSLGDNVPWPRQTGNDGGPS